MPLALYLLALAVFAMGTSEFMLSGLLPGLAADLGVPLGAAGLVTSAYAAGMVVGAPALAILARRWPARPVLLVTIVVFAICHLIGAATSSFAVLLLTRVVAAVANAGFLAVALTVAAGLVGEERKGRAVAVLLGGTTLALVAGAPAGAALGSALDWRATFVAVAALCVPAAAGVIRRPRPGTPTPDAPVPLREELAHLRTGAVRRTLLGAALVNAGTFAALTYLAPLVTRAAGLAEAWVPVSLALVGAGACVGIAVAGRVADRHPVAVLAVGGSALVAVWVGAALVAASPVLLLVGLFLAGAVSFGVGSAFVARILTVAAGAATLRGSFATAALNVGAVSGPLLGAAALASPAGEVGVLGTAAVVSGVALAWVLPDLRRGG